MPRFFIFIFLLDAFSIYKIWALVKEIPSSLSEVHWLLFWLFLATTLTLAVPIFLILKGKLPPIPNERPIFRKALKIAGIITSGPILYLTLRANSLVTTINTGLLLLLYAMILLSLKKNR